jgi:hypothetical protein
MRPDEPIPTNGCRRESGKQVKSSTLATSIRTTKESQNSGARRPEPTQAELAAFEAYQEVDRWLSLGPEKLTPEQQKQYRAAIRSFEEKLRLCTSDGLASALSSRSPANRGALERS